MIHFSKCSNRSVVCQAHTPIVAVSALLALAGCSTDGPEDGGVVDVVDGNVDPFDAAKRFEETIRLTGEWTYPTLVELKRQDHPCDLEACQHNQNLHVGLVGFEVIYSIDQTLFPQGSTQQAFYAAPEPMVSVGDIGNVVWVFPRPSSEAPAMTCGTSGVSWNLAPELLFESYVSDGYTRSEAIAYVAQSSGVSSNITSFQLSEFCASSAGADAGCPQSDSGLPANCD